MFLLGGLYYWKPIQRSKEKDQTSWNDEAAGGSSMTKAWPPRVLTHDAGIQGEPVWPCLILRGASIWLTASAAKGTYGQRPRSALADYLSLRQQRSSNQLCTTPASPSMPPLSAHRHKQAHTQLLHARTHSTHLSTATEAPWWLFWLTCC